MSFMVTSEPKKRPSRYPHSRVPPNRIPSLDGLRGLSISLVLTGHFAYSAGSPIHHSWLTDYYAHYGVRIFFVISGFLITTLLERERAKTGRIDVRQFYLRRAYRILPVAYVYLIVMVVVFHKSFTPRELTLAFTYLSSYAGNMSWSLSHLWSLSVEEQFYLIWPVAAAVGVLWSRRLALLAIVVAPLFRYLPGKYGMFLGGVGSFPTVADSIASGCLLALWQPRLQSIRSFFAWRGFPLIWLGTLSIPVMAHFLIGSGRILFLWPLPQILGHSAITIFNFGIVLCLQSAIVAPPRILNATIPVWIGTLSYSLYLWQMPFANPGVKSWATTFPVNIVLAFLAATVSFYFIEQPILRMRERKTQQKSSHIEAASCPPPRIVTPTDGRLIAEG